MDPELDFFTLEDASLILKLLDSIDASLITSNTVYIQGDLTTQLDLDALAGSLHGITDPIGQLQSWLYDRLMEFVSWISSTVESVFRTIISPIESTINSIWSWIQKIPGTVYSALDFIEQSIRGIWNLIQENLIDPLTSALDALQSIVDTITTGINNVVNTVTTFIATLPSSINQLLSDAWNWIQNNIITPLTGTIDQLINNVMQGLDTITSFFTKTLPESINKLLSDAWNWIQQNIIAPISNALNTLNQWIQQGITSLVDFFTKTLPQWLESGWNTFTGWLQGVWNWIQQNIITPLNNALATLGNWIQQGINTIADFFMKTLPQWLQSGWNTFVGWLQNTWNWIQQNVITPLWNTLQQFSNWIWSGLESLGKFFTETLPQWFNNVIGDIQRGVGGLVEWISKGFNSLVSTISDYFSKIGEWIVEATNRLRDLGATFQGFVNAIMFIPTWFSPVIEFFRKLYEGFTRFIQDPVGTINRTIITPLVNTLGPVFQQVYNALVGVGSAIVNAFGNALNTLLNALGTAITNIVSATTAGLNTLIQGLKAIAEKVATGFEWIVQSFFSAFIERFKGVITSTSEIYVREFGQTGYIERLHALWINQTMQAMQAASSVILSVVASLFATRFLAYVIRGIGFTLAGVFGDIEVDLSPLGLGIVKPFRLGPAIAGLSNDLAEIISGWAKDFSSGMITSITLWVSRPLSRIITALFRNMLPVRLPALGLLVDALRRKIPTKAFPDVVDITTYYMALYGYSDTVLEWFFKYPKEAFPLVISDKAEYIEVIDRFGKTRIIPTSLLFRLPTPAEISRIMVRDIVQDPLDFMKFIALHGVPRDVSLFYYLLRFRYPSPERLWNFYTRALAGALWFTPPQPDPNNPLWQDVYQLIEVYGIDKSYIPAAPSALNVTSKKIHDLHLQALTRYLKWHDYAPMSWIPGYTSDRFIVFDLMADLPTKIDMRWMQRWAIFEQIGKYVTDINAFIVSDVVSIIQKTTGKELIQTRPTGKITMDVRLFAKLLQSTGLHPYWVPVVSVAEAINALVDERTLLRTGIINLYREGLIDINLAETLMSGLFVTEFRTAYFDTVEGKWKEITWNVPVVWLPAERTLLEMRSIMDRVILLFRRYMYAVVNAVRYYVLKPSEAADNVREFAATLLGFASSELKLVTGVDTKLLMDERYISLWINYASKLSEWEAKRRVRYWMFRLVAWLFYRIAYGWVTEEDIDKVVNVLRDKAYISVYEADAIKEVMKTFAGVVGKEYIPTPITLSTIVEYVPSAVEKLEEVLEKNRVPEDWRDIWREYIYAKALKSDYKSLVSVYIRALKYNVISQKEWDEFKKQLVKYGFSDEEIRILQRRAELEELIATSREYLPTPSTLATLSEYIELPLDLVRKALEARRVPVEWLDIWLRYIQVKPVKSDYKSYLTTAIRAYRLGVITQDALDSILKEAVNYGFTQKELSILQRRIELEVAIEGSREYLPTPSTLATLSEYMVLPVELVRQVLEKRRVPPDWIEIWLQYIRVRPLKGDYRSYLTVAIRALREGVITQDDFKKILTDAKNFGFTDAEIELIQRRVELELAIEYSKEYLPTPSSLATLSEYIELPRDLVKKVLEARRVPEEWLNIWLHYIQVKPVKSDYKSLLSVAIRAFRLGVIKQDVLDSILREAVNYGFTQRELAILQRRIELEVAIESSQEYLPTPSTLATLSEYIMLPVELVRQVLERRRVPAEWIDIWLQYIQVKPLKSDYRAYISTAIRALRAGVITQRDFEKILQDARQYGFTDPEIAIIQARTELELAIENAREYIPTLSQLAVMAEYIHVPQDIINKVITLRRVPADFARLWIQYINARAISSEVNTLASTARRIYEYFDLPKELLDQVINIMRQGGWTETELRIFNLDLQLRKAYRLMAYLIPTIRQFVSDAYYLAEWEKLLDDLLKARGIDVEKYKQQIEYYKKLIKNRKVYRRISWYITRLMNAYANDLITLDEVKRRLEQLKRYGLDDDEIRLILDGLELHRAYIKKVYGQGYYQGYY